jgi:hypothetical protein
VQDVDRHQNIAAGEQQFERRVLSAASVAIDELVSASSIAAHVRLHRFDLCSTPTGADMRQDGPAVAEAAAVHDPVCRRDSRGSLFAVTW